MNVDSILLSAAAALTRDNQLSVLNVFNSMSAAHFPAKVPLMALSLIIHAHHSEGGSEHKLDVRVLNEKREIVAEIVKDQVFRFSDETPVPGIPLRFIHLQVMANVQFESPGAYAFEVSIDGTYAAGTAFYVGQTAS